jgi:hypothetical protein
MSDDGPVSAPKKADPAKKEVAQQLWERLAKSRPGPDNKDLMFLARFVPLLSSGAVKTLLGRKLTLAELKELIEHVPKAREGAIKMALALSSEQLGEDDLRFILTHSKSVEVAKHLLKRFPTDSTLILVENNVDGLKDVIEKMRQMESTRDVLREIDRKL